MRLLELVLVIASSLLSCFSIFGAPQRSRPIVSREPASRAGVAATIDRGVDGRQCIHRYRRKSGGGQRQARNRVAGRVLGFGPESGVFLGGLWSGDADYLFGGGVDPKAGI